MIRVLVVDDEHPVGVHGRVDRQQNLLPRKRFHFWRPEMDDVDIVPSRGGLGHGPLQHAIGTGAPHGDFDPVSRFERMDESGKILFGDRGVER